MRSMCVSESRPIVRSTKDWSTVTRFSHCTTDGNRNPVACPWGVEMSMGNWAAVPTKRTRLLVIQGNNRIRQTSVELVGLDDQSGTHLAACPVAEGEIDDDNVAARHLRGSRSLRHPFPDRPILPVCLLPGVRTSFPFRELSLIE